MILFSPTIQLNLNFCQFNMPHSPKNRAKICKLSNNSDQEFFQPTDQNSPLNTNTAPICNTNNDATTNISPQITNTTNLQANNFAPNHDQNLFRNSTTNNFPIPFTNQHFQVTNLDQVTDQNALEISPITLTNFTCQTASTKNNSPPNATINISPQLTNPGRPRRAASDVSNLTTYQRNLNSSSEDTKSPPANALSGGYQYNVGSTVNMYPPPALY